MYYGGITLAELPVRIPKVKRKKTSCYFDPAIYGPFVKACHAVGDSTCGVLEPYMYAFTEAVKRGVPVQAANLTLNLNVVREVQRSRRSVKRRNVSFEVVEAGSLERCSYCGRPSMYEISRWPSKDLCVHEYVCVSCYHSIKPLMPHFGREQLAPVRR